MYNRRNCAMHMGLMRAGKPYKMLKQRVFDHCKRIHIKDIFRAENSEVRHNEICMRKN